MAVESDRVARRGALDASTSWRAFRRARHALWGLLALLVGAGAFLHDLTVNSLAARLVWLGGVALTIGWPLRSLLAFRCPRCGGVFLATGGLRDFLGIGRILWANRCGACDLPAGHGHDSDLPDAAPITSRS
jgi:hypothetical protein